MDGTVNAQTQETQSVNGVIRNGTGKRVEEASKISSSPQEVEDPKEDLALF